MAEHNSLALTIGMATYKDFDGVAFTLRSLQLHHDMADVELLVVDNFGCDETRKFCGKVGARYIRAADSQGSCAPRDRVFREAAGSAVLCLDCHVLLWPGAIAKLKQLFREIGERDSGTGNREEKNQENNLLREASSPDPGPRTPVPSSLDLIQGPLLHDSGMNVSTHLDAVWRGQMWGTWGTDPRGLDTEAEPFEIRANGLGLFACRKDAWPGFNPHFRGFGGGEGYIQEKIRQRGGKVWCAPWLRWWHRFSRPAGVPYPLTVADKFRNYLVGHAELGLPLEPILEHFAGKVPEAQAMQFVHEALELADRSGQLPVASDQQEKTTTARVAPAPPVFSLPRSTCPHRVNVTTGVARERATCRLLQQITGAEESECIVQLDACRACMKADLPSAERPNYVVASLAVGIAKAKGDADLAARVKPFLPRATGKPVKRSEECVHLGAVVERKGSCQRCWDRECNQVGATVQQRRECEDCPQYEPV